jgi:hypothetical protein
LLFLIDFNTYGEDLMIDSEFSSPTVKFDYDHYLGNIQVRCLGEKPFEDYSKIGSAKPVMTVSIHGTNDVSYSLKRSTIELEIVQEDDIAPTITTKVKEVKKVEASIDIETNQQGMFFY